MVATALQLTAVAGAIGVVGLLIAAMAAGLFCSSCALTYALTLAYAAIALIPFKVPRQRWQAGAGLAAGLTLVVFALVAGLGPRTPHSVSGHELVAEVPPADPGPDSTQLNTRLGAYLASLPDDARAILSRVLILYRQAPPVPPETPRAAVGPVSAPVLITDFTDALCSHCAELHETLSALRNMVPDQVRIDSRHYPLDGHCNANLPIRGEQVRLSCMAAKAQICMEGSPQRFEYSGALFRNQAGLTAEQIYQLAAPDMPQAALEACIASPETAAKLAADVAYAARFNPQGTPLVLVNGREAPAFGPFLLALALAGGNANHPAFATLPAPDLGSGS